MRANRLVLLTTIVVLLLSCTASSQTNEDGKALFLKSLVVPGWGQYEAGRLNHALAFLGTDLLLIGAALSLDHHGRQLQADYKAFAESHAGVSGNHGKEFYIDVANWLSVFDYNEQRTAERNFGAVYDTETQFWMWDNESNRSRMDEMRLTSDRSLNRVIYAVALIGVNHLVSAFHAGRLQSQNKEAHENRLGWQISPVRVPDGGKVSLAMWW